VKTPPNPRGCSGRASLGAAHSERQKVRGDGGVLNNTRRGFVDEETFWRIYDALKPFSVRADISLFAFRSAWRRGEIESITFEQIDMQAKECRLWDSKSGYGRVLPLEGELLEVIERRLAARRFETATGPALSRFVFHEHGAPLGDWRKSWATACNAAGVPGLLFHDLRRSAIRNMILAGTPSVVARAISGHRTTAILDRYSIMTTTETRQALRSTVEYLRRSGTNQVRSE
jgi:integrase